MVVREKNCYYAIALTDFFVFLSCAEKYNIRDTEDTSDCLMSSKDQRATFEKLMLNGTMDNSAIHAIIDGNPVVSVDLFPNHANVRIY